MKEWYEIQFKLEKILESIIMKESEDEDMKELGDYLISNILICKEVAEQKEHQDELWLNIREDLFIRFENSQLPGEVFLGQSLLAKDESGFNVSVVVKEINEDHIIVDANHPLAGENLIFDIEIMNINENPSE